MDEVPISPAVWYNLGQTGIYGVMALGIMRLKLFFTPHLCIITALLAKDKVKVQENYLVKTDKKLLSF